MPDRRRVVNGVTYKLKLSCENLYVTVNKQDGKIFEVFGVMGKSGGCETCLINSLCKTISKSIQAGCDIESIIKTLDNMSCDKVSFGHGLDGYDYPIKSCVDGIAKVLKKENNKGD